MAGLYFEDFDVGRRFRHELARTVTEADNTTFSLMTMNLQPLHIDAHFAESTAWGQRLFNSMATLAIMVGLSVQETTLGTTMGNLGMSDVRFPKPVFHGDTLRAETEVISKRASRSHPNAGIVELEHSCFNQHGTLVAVCRRAAMMWKKKTA